MKYLLVFTIKEHVPLNEDNSNVVVGRDENGNDIVLQKNKDYVIGKKETININFYESRYPYNSANLNYILDKATKVENQDGNTRVIFDGFTTTSGDMNNYLLSYKGSTNIANIDNYKIDTHTPESLKKCINNFDKYHVELNVREVRYNISHDSLKKLDQTQANAYKAYIDYNELKDTLKYVCPQNQEEILSKMYTDKSYKGLSDQLKKQLAV